LHDVREDVHLPGEGRAGRFAETLSVALRSTSVIEASATIMER